jgi:hypothetical protein
MQTKELEELELEFAKIKETSKPREARRLYLKLTYRNLPSMMF